jgi:hypothetical protein
MEVDDVGKSGPLLISLTSIHDEICRVELLVVVVVVAFFKCVTGNENFTKRKKLGHKLVFPPILISG